ncbi:RICIN domain-containing protein [Paenibacillus athensensis]|uniref:RICIN domain-containing protein n=1 Tax=Paenibacillus athensensis TaxID=1967502 RepID=UPI001E3392F4|nr:RICIN domain-containing protein [Paenibacillus athensensis]
MKQVRLSTGNAFFLWLLAVALLLAPLALLPAAVTAAGTVSLPGKVEAEEWSAMSGVQTEATSDTGGGSNVGWIDAGDWMDYSVNVTAAGTYKADLRVASPNSGQQLQLRNSSGTVLGTANVPNTGGWQSWSTVSVNVSLSAGTQTLRVYAVTTGLNLNWLSFSSQSGSIVSGGTYKLINPNSGKALDVAGGGTADGTNVQIWTDNGSAAQQWQTNRNSDGTYTLINAGSGKALDVAAAGTADGSNVQIYTSNGTGAQKWSINSNGDGTYLLLNQNAGKALDVVSAGTADGTNVQIWGNTATTARKWQLVQVSVTSPPSGFIVSEAQFNQMFPSRNSFYTYSGLLAALGAYPGFTTTGSTTIQKQEAAAFLANVAHETGSLQYIVELNTANYPYYCASSSQYPCASGKQYYGRGPLQLSWNYNYGAAGAALGLPLLSNPDLVAQDSSVAWKTALWFWNTQTGAGTMTAHNAMVNSAGFGETIRTINGALECNGSNQAQMQARINYYNSFTSILGVSAGTHLACYP